MNMRLSLGSAAAAAMFVCLGVSGAQAAMPANLHTSNSAVTRVDCAVGFHLGPAGACIIGTDEPRRDDTVIERRATDEGCQTKSVQRTDAMGNTETHTRTNCD